MENLACRILLIDDDRASYVLTRTWIASISRARYEVDWIATYDAALAAILAAEHDVVLLDYELGARSGLDLLREARRRGFCEPVIMLTANDDPEVDRAAMIAGATDFLVKGELNEVLLERAIRYALERRRAEQERELLIIQLQDALAHVKRLQGIIPICSYCKQIRDGEDSWSRLETYISEHSDAHFSHGICPACYEQRARPELERLRTDETGPEPPSAL